MNRGFLIVGVIGLMFGFSACGKKTDQNTLRWVSLGDSLTVGYGGTPEQSYPERVVELSRESEIKIGLVKNLANGGHTLAKMQLLQLSRLGFYKPDIVTIWIGTNDAILNAAMDKKYDLASREPLPTSKESFKKRFDEVVKKLMKLQVKKVFIGLLHDLDSLPIADEWSDSTKENVRSLVKEYNEVILDLASVHPFISVVPLNEVSELIDLNFICKMEFIQNPKFIFLLPRPFGPKCRKNCNF